MTQVVIGERVFQIHDPLAIELILLLEKGKRFWEWEKEIRELKRLLEATKEVAQGGGKADGGPAFPNVIKHVPEHERHDMTHEYQLLGGTSLRDWFAGMALPECQRIMAHEDDYFTSDTCEIIAAMTYKMADAMLAERSK